MTALAIIYFVFGTLWLSYLVCYENHPRRLTKLRFWSVVAFVAVFWWVVLLMAAYGQLEDWMKERRKAI